MVVDVVAAVIRRDGKILITQRLDNVDLAGLWEFPGGKVEAGESFDAALQREISEELGVKIRIGHEFFTVDHDYPTKSVRLHFFHCTIVEGVPAPLAVATPPQSESRSAQPRPDRPPGPKPDRPLEPVPNG